MAGFMLYVRRKISGLPVDTGYNAEKNRFRPMECYMCFENRSNAECNDDDFGKATFWFGPISVVIILASWVIFLLVPAFILTGIKFMEGVFRIEIWDKSFKEYLNGDIDI